MCKEEKGEGVLPDQLQKEKFGNEKAYFARTYFFKGKKGHMGLDVRTPHRGRPQRREKKEPMKRTTTTVKR